MRWACLGLALVLGIGAVGEDAPSGSRVKAIPPLPAGPPSHGEIPADIAALVRSVSTQPLAQRVEAISAAFVGKPYALDPLGEGAPPDTDPYARYDAFDCLTYVEEVLALSLAPDPAFAADVRNSLRYGDSPRDYAHRHHFMELQWLPENVRQGWIRDTTKEYGAVTHLEREVTPTTWSSWNKRSLFKLTDAELPMGLMQLDVLPLDVALKAVDAIRPGSILLTVRSDRGRPLWTTHLGFVVSGSVHRNASRRSAMRVVDEDLAGYLQHLRTYGNWPVAGVAVFEPIESPSRLVIR